jgi:hypothetical protein
MPARTVGVYIIIRTATGSEFGSHELTVPKYITYAFHALPWNPPIFNQTKGRVKLSATLFLARMHFGELRT